MNEYNDGSDQAYPLFGRNKVKGVGKPVASEGFFRMLQHEEAFLFIQSRKNIKGLKSPPSLYIQIQNVH
uniref:SH2 domain-containing protein n=1 Tax=Panagrellus redivivus TaxID=6233 RepID=A0A7E4VK38_PANRE